MPHSQTHAPLHSAYELVVLGKQTPALVLERNVWTNYSSAQFQQAQKPIKFYLQPYWRGFFTMLWVAKGRNWNCRQ